MSFSRADKLKVKAGLAELHGAGHDTGEVTRLAEAHMRNGTPERMAYERAFNGFVARVPAMQAPLQRIGQLIDSYGPRSLARYDVALTNYIATGDRAHIEAIAPAVAHDMANMARTTGDAGFADALPESAPVGDRNGPGWQAGPGFRPADARARPDAPLPPTDPLPPSAESSRPGWPAGMRMGFQPSAARAGHQPGE